MKYSKRRRSRVSRRKNKTFRKNFWGGGNKEDLINALNELNADTINSRGKVLKLLVKVHPDKNSFLEGDERGMELLNALVSVLNDLKEDISVDKIDKVLTNANTLLQYLSPQMPAPQNIPPPPPRQTRAPPPPPPRQSSRAAAAAEEEARRRAAEAEEAQHRAAEAQRRARQTAAAAEEARRRSAEAKKRAAAAAEEERRRREEEERRATANAQRRTQAQFEKRRTTFRPNVGSNYRNYYDDLPEPIYNPPRDLPQMNYDPKTMFNQYKQELYMDYISLKNLIEGKEDMLWRLNRKKQQLKTEKDEFIKEQLQTEIEMEEENVKGIEKLKKELKEVEKELKKIAPSKKWGFW